MILKFKQRHKMETWGKNIRKPSKPHIFSVTAGDH